MDFSSPVIYGETLMFYKGSTPPISLWVLFNPLSLGLLVSVLVCVVTLTVLLVALEWSHSWIRLRKEYLKEDQPTNSTTLEETWDERTRLSSSVNMCVNVAEAVLSALFNERKRIMFYCYYFPIFFYNI